MKKVIVHLIPQIPSWGGAESVLLDIARTMDKDRFEMVVVFWGAHDELAAPLREAGARVAKLEFGRIVSFASVRRLADVLKEYQADLVHTHFIDSDLLAVAAAWSSGIPVVTHVHSFPFPQNAWQSLRYRLMAPRIARTICVSACVRAHVRRSTGMPMEKLPLVPNGIDTARYAQVVTDDRKRAIARALGLAEGLSPGDLPVIGCVARFAPVKSMPVFIRAAARVVEAYPQAQFLAIGDGEERLLCEALARELGVDDNIVFTGTRADVPELLSVMDVFALPCVREAFGIVLLEAMASGVPIVAADAAAIPELVRDGQEGLLYAPKDPDAMARAILRLLDDPALAGQLARAAWERAAGFTREAMVRRIEQVYDEVLGRD